MTFTCSILKLSGAPSIRNIIKLSVIMPIIGKISEENLNYSIIMPMIYVLIGKEALSLVNTKKVVYSNLLA